MARLARRVVGAALLAAACRRTAPAVLSEVDAEDLVHRAALMHAARGLTRGAPLYVAAQVWPAPAPPAEDSGRVPRALVGGVPATLWRAYVAANTAGRPVRLPTRLGGRHVVVTDAGPPDPPAALRYVHVVSRVGFTPGGDSAIVRVSQSCGPLCGSSALLLVTRDLDGWRVTRALWHALH